MAKGVWPLWVTPRLPAASVAVPSAGERPREAEHGLSPAAPCQSSPGSGATRRQEQAEGRKVGRKEGVAEMELGEGGNRKEMVNSKPHV